MLISLSFVSCSKDDEENVESNASTGNYWPSAVNNQWIFNLNGVEQAPMKIISSSTDGGDIYYNFNETEVTGAAAALRIKKSNGNYYIKIDDIVVPAEMGMPGSTSTGYEVILLKDYLPVGGTWTSNYTQKTGFTDPAYPSISLDVNVVASILEKDATVTVNGHSYADVIKVKYVQNVSFFGINTTTVSYYWFSKNVGPVKVVHEIDGEVQTNELVSSIILQ